MKSGSGQEFDEKERKGQMGKLGAGPAVASPRCTGVWSQLWSPGGVAAGKQTHAGSMDVNAGPAFVTAWAAEQTGHRRNAPKKEEKIKAKYIAS